MRKIPWLAGTMLLVALLIGQTVRAADTFTDPDGHFSFTPPDGYAQYSTQQVSQAVRSGSNLLGVSGIANQVVVAYRAPLSIANVNVGASALPDPNAMVDDVVMAERDVLSSIDAVPITLEDTEETTLANEPARSFAYSLTVNGIDLRGRQVIAVHNGSAYFITFTALASSADRAFEQMQGVIDTFMFLD